MQSSSAVSDSNAENPPIPGPRRAAPAAGSSAAPQADLRLVPAAEQRQRRQQQQPSQGDAAAGGAGRAGGGEEADGTKLRSACDNCSLKKIKCDGVKPCQACNKRDVICHFSVKRPTGPKKQGPYGVSTGSAGDNSTPPASHSPKKVASTTPTRPEDFVTSPRGGKRLRLIPPADGSSESFNSGGGRGGGSTTSNDEDKAGKREKKKGAASERGGVATRRASGGGARGGKARAGQAVATAATAAASISVSQSLGKPRSGGDGNGGGVAPEWDADKKWRAQPHGGVPGADGSVLVSGTVHAGPGAVQPPPHEWGGWQGTEDRAGGLDGAVGGGGGGAQGVRRNQGGGTARGAGGAHKRKGGGIARETGEHGHEQEARPLRLITEGDGGKTSKRGDRGSGTKIPSKRGGDGSGRGGRGAGGVGGRGGIGVVGAGRGARGGGRGRDGGRTGGGHHGLGEIEPRNAYGRHHSGSENPPPPPPPSSLAAFDSVRALGEREKHLLDVFLNMVNEFLPFINEDLVEAMQKDIPSTPVGSARNRRSLPAWSASPEMDTERLSRGALINAALSVGALVTRDRAAAVGFSNCARQCLKEIFDAPSEEAASAFLCLAYYNMNSGEGLRADLYLVQAHSFCLNLEDFPLNLEICIEHLSYARLKIELRPNFHSWGNRRYQVLHVANHVLSTLTQQGEYGLPAALQTNDPSRFEGGEEALLRCVHELVGCIEISERDTLARLICSSLVGLLLMLLGRRKESIAVAESVVDGVSPTPVIMRVMPLSWTATIVTSALLFIYERHAVYTRLYAMVAPAQKPPAPGHAGECLLPVPGSDVETYLQHQCEQSTFCRMVVTIAQLTNRGTVNFCPFRQRSQGPHPHLYGMIPHTRNGFRKPPEGDRYAASPMQRRPPSGGERGHSQQVAGEALGEGEDDMGANSLAGLLGSPVQSMQRSAIFDSEYYGEVRQQPKGWPDGGADAGTRNAQVPYPRQQPVPFVDRNHHQSVHHMQHHVHHHQQQQLQQQQQPRLEQQHAPPGGGGGMTARVAAEQAGHTDLNQRYASAHSSRHRGPPLFPGDLPGQQLSVNDFSRSRSPSFTADGGDRGSGDGGDAGKGGGAVSPMYGQAGNTQSAGKDDGLGEREQQQQQQQQRQQQSQRHQQQQSLMQHQQQQQQQRRQQQEKPRAPQHDQARQRAREQPSAHEGASSGLQVPTQTTAPTDTGGGATGMSEPPLLRCGSGNGAPSTPPPIPPQAPREGGNSAIRDHAGGNFDYGEDFLPSRSMDSGELMSLMGADGQ